MELIPMKATFTPGEPVDIELVGAHGATIVQLWHLDRLVGEVSVGDGAVHRDRGAPAPARRHDPIGIDESLYKVGGVGEPGNLGEAGSLVNTATVGADGRVVAFDDVAEGGYAVLATDSIGTQAATAVDVLADPFLRPRYGFVAEFPPDGTAHALVDTTRRLHLNLIQFYDWAHRYAQLVPDTPEYLDPLGRRLSLHTVRELTAALGHVGSLAMGSAAVYAVGGVDWDDWKHAGLFKADGEPHRFPDDLLLVVDPSNPEWLKHFAADLRLAMVELGFDGFHLDSYGWPKRAYRADGTVCDLAEAFPILLEHLRSDVSSARLLFNNVNDFPTWSTTRTRQNGTYIEVWSPHTTLGHLGGLAERARAIRACPPPILAAYLTTYAAQPAQFADATARLTMATIFSHGATHLLNGAGGTVLVDPYYPKNHISGASTRRLMQTWYDFLVRYGDLLLDPGAVDVTRSYTGGINEDLIFSAPEGVRVSTDPEPGTVWVRVVRTRLGLVLHLINLSDQAETGWDTPKHPVTGVSGVRLRALKTLAMLPPRSATPDGDGALHPLPVDSVSARSERSEPRSANIGDSDATYDVLELPELGAWTMVVLPDPVTWPAAR
jgi:dextranase